MKTYFFISFFHFPRRAHILFESPVLLVMHNKEKGVYFPQIRGAPAGRKTA
jgi:hypothetical protein